MKTIITSSFLGAVALALPAMADKPSDCSKPDACIIQSANANDAIVNAVSAKVGAQPSTAGEVVKQAILDTKASPELVLQIVKAAVVAAPEQAEAVRKVAVALAPESEEDIELVIASVLQGDQVADTDEPDAGEEPEGNDRDKNTVWLTNKGAGKDGKNSANRIDSKVQNTADSPNQHHNTDGRTEGGRGQGGGTVVVTPVTPNGMMYTP